MKLWNAMRWRPIHITSTTTQSWKRYISASAPSLRDAVKIESSDTGKPADAKAKAAKTEVKHEIATDVPKEDHRAKKSSRRWTDAEIRILMEAYDAGLRDRAIQEKLPGRTLLSVQQAVNLYRLQGPSAFKYEPAQPWTPDEKATLRRLHAAGTRKADYLQHFPNRTLRSVLAALSSIRPSLSYSLIEPGSRRHWSASETERLRDLVAQGNAYAAIAEVLGRALSSVKVKAQRMGIHQQQWWTQERHDTMLRMMAGGHSSSDVASHLGTSQISVLRKYHCSRDPESVSQLLGGATPRGYVFTLSPPEVQEIISLKRQGKIWPDIRAEKYPHVSSHTLQGTFHKLARGIYDNGKATVLSMSPADYDDIERLREDGKSWRYIAKLKYPDRDELQVSDVFRTKRMKKNERSGEHFTRHARGLLMLDADVADLERLRKEGKSWAAIAKLKYPNTDSTGALKAFNRRTEAQKNRQDPNQFIPDVDMEEIKRLLEQGAKWPAITKLRFPDRSARSVFRNFDAQMKARDEKGYSVERFHILSLSSDEVEVIENMRKEGRSWKVIFQLTYPHRRPVAVKRAFELKIKERDEEQSKIEPGDE